MRAWLVRGAVVWGLSFARAAAAQQAPQGKPVVVEIDGEGYSSPPTLEQRGPSGWQPVCVAPCRRTFDSDGRYRMSGGEKSVILSDPDTGSKSSGTLTFRSSPEFRLPPEPGTEKLHVDGVTNDGIIVGIPFLALGVGCLVPAGIALAGGFSHDTGIRLGVGLPLVAGGALFGAFGIFGLTRSTHVTDSLGRRLAKRGQDRTRLGSLYLAPWEDAGRQAGGLTFGGRF